jgi:hypothetical protein
VARQRVQSTGFRDPEWMRRAFIRAFGQPPQSLRPCGKGRVALFCQPPLCWFAWTALSKSLCQAGLPGSPGATNLSLLAARSDA